LTGRVASRARASDESADAAGFDAAGLDAVVEEGRVAVGDDVVVGVSELGAGDCSEVAAGAAEVSSAVESQPVRVRPATVATTSRDSRDDKRGKDIEGTPENDGAGRLPLSIAPTTPGRYTT